MIAIEPRVLIITADAASVSDGKLNLLGGGWTQIGAGPSNFTVVVRVDIPHSMTNQQIPWSLALVDQDGHKYVPMGSDQPVELAGDLHMERPESGDIADTFNAPMLFPFMGLPLVPGTYEWVFTFAGYQAKYGFRVL
ncbi:MAG: hypothetical protein EBS36_05995 [Actinobacteria bacterium]|nr:hypothetical protein [Actinomycetota bacterium]NBY15028.1 hypothetical protein [Actinomycetota bacterium]